MGYTIIDVPANGEKITIRAGKLQVPDHPIIPFVEGDGTGRDIWRASKRVLDAAVEKSYNGSTIQWMEVYSGEKAYGRVELEITETTLMLDAERTLPLLDELRAMGVHLSIDDFGTGYSSLSALQQFPIGTLKIDQSFVRNAATDPDDATIVRTIIEMGRSMGLQVLAEGIETEEQRYFLLHAGCQYGQGRLFGEPISASEFFEVILRQSTGQHPVLQLPA